MPRYDDCDRESELSELRAEARARRRGLAQLAAHPDTRDPDYPGDDDDDEQEGDD